ncbi:MAG: hypothetical protein KZQ59_16520, partial [Candidatus Thiodiazotropha sp. (ex Lucinoma aequizonata)]|nr:hypothetical protein [Candidatus Thiodiazotropha sp. (ex Lucinoma aequizonata)]
CGCTSIYRFFDQFNSSTAIRDIDHSSSVPPQIAWAFFLRTSRAAVSARAFSLRLSSRSNSLIRFSSVFLIFFNRLF